MASKSNPTRHRPNGPRRIEIVKRAWSDEPLTFEGKYYQIPERHVVPKPLQKPHPPLWLAGTNPETFEKAGRSGLGLLGFVTATPDEVEPRVAAYRAGVADPEPIGDFINDQVAILMQTYCAETNAEALAVAEPAVTRSAELAAELFLPWAEPGATKNAESYKYLTEQSRTGAAAAGAGGGARAQGRPRDRHAG